ncbi:aminotransferase class V-fold PLP-dependent enzyme [Lentzea sp. NPDC051838]|uniref:aminotransferase class V-fold PLP-dependent enzyme n=1 Tax=Lentzea sp. NPDC051838 TaxID=3154849 RepID=UPI00342368AC
MPSQVNLDQASTSAPKPDLVWEAIRDHVQRGGGSPGRGGHSAMRRVDAEVEDARAVLARVIGTSDPARISFTANATHALNTCLKGFLRPGDDVVITTAQHNSVLRPLDKLRKAGVIGYRAVADLTGLRDELRPNTRLVVVNHACNVTGAVAPLGEITEMAHRHGAAVLVDCAQSAGVLDLEADRDNVDMLAFTGHKALLGPSGIGGLFLRRPDEVDTLVEGGTGSMSHSLNHPKAMPAKFEAGTANYLGIVALGATAALAHKQQQENRTRALALVDDAVERLSSIPGLRIHHAHTAERVPLFSFTLDDWYPGEIAAELDERHGILTRPGLQCAPLVHKALGTFPHGTVRVSLGHATTADDIDALVAGVKELC